MPIEKFRKVYLEEKEYIKDKESDAIYTEADIKIAKEARENQLSKWLLGESTHNDLVLYKEVMRNPKDVIIKKLIGGECCPDFSCCYPQLLWDEEKRKLFIKSDSTDREKFLRESLRDLAGEVGL